MTFGQKRFASFWFGISDGNFVVIVVWISRFPRARRIQLEKYTKMEFSRTEPNYPNASIELQTVPDQSHNRCKSLAF